MNLSDFGESLLRPALSVVKLGAWHGGASLSAHRLAPIEKSLGAVGRVTPGDRWRQLGKRFKTHAHSMTYNLELEGHVKRGEIACRDVDRAHMRQEAP